MIDAKDFLGISAIALTFIGYVPYMRDILSGKTKPHVYTWFIWSLLNFIIFALQITHNAGSGSFMTLAVGIVSFTIFMFARKADNTVTSLDTAFLILALLALLVWIFAKQPIISMVLLVAIDALGFAPTICKSWHKPYSETLSSYVLNTFRFGLALLALRQYTIITALYPLVWIVANGLFSTMLITRRKQLAPN
jgi:hypothetical protein